MRRHSLFGSMSLRPIAALTVMLVGGVAALCLLAGGGNPPTPAADALDATTATIDQPIAAVPPPRESRSAVAAIQHRGPSIRIADTNWDFGELPAGTDLVHTFVLHNDGDAAFKIVRAKPG